jgi:hypothetical protein
MIVHEWEFALSHFMFGFSKSQEFPDLEVNVEFNDDDLNDPELLAELAKMTMEDRPPAKILAPVVAVAVEPVVEVETILAQLPPEGDVDVEVTEEDMNNPELLAELAAVTGHIDEHIEPQKVEKESLKSPAVEVVPVTTPIAQTEYDEASLELKLKSTNIEYLQQHVQLEKIQALNKKRAGDKQGALDHLRASKRLQARMDELQTASTPVSKAASAIREAPPAATVQVVTSKEPIAPKPDPIIDESTLLYEERIVEYKKAAIKSKSQPAKAKEYLIIAKSIQQECELRKNGTPTTGYVLPPKPVLDSLPATSEPQSPQKVLIGPSTSVPMQPTSPQSQSELVNHLKSRLEQQISTCTKLSAQYFTANQKEMALEYHKKKKAMQQELDTLKSIQDSHIPFRFVQEDIEYTIAQTHADVPLDEICVEIVSAKDLYVKDVSDLETVVVFDLGWPFNASGTLPQGKGETSIQKGADPLYKFCTNVKIERTKAFQRFLDRKKATFEIYYIAKSLFGMMARRVLLGKMIVKLDDLLSKREIHQMVPIMDPQNPRKAVGGSVEVLLRMRAPLIKPDLLTTKEAWMRVVFGETSPLEAPKPIPQPVPTSPKKPAETVIPKETSQPKSPSPPQSQQSPVEEDDLEEQFNKYHVFT